MNSRKKLMMLFSGLFLAGCTVGPDYSVPATTMPSSFGVAPASTQPAGAVKQVDLARWWKVLNDPVLDSLIERAVQANPDVEVALARLGEARMEESMIWGRSMPTSEFSGAAGVGSGTNSTKGRIAAPLNAATNTTGLKEITQVVGFDAGWELDLWGKYKRAIEAAHADTQAAAEFRNAVLVSVIADVARAYADLRSMQLLLAIARENIRTEKQTTDLIEARFNRGLTNELDVTLARRELASVEAMVAPVEASGLAAQRRIAVLLGGFPDDLAKELTPPKMIPLPPDSIQPGLPLDLLRRRPDIRQSERELAAATARIGVATANLYPNVAITGGLGMQGQGLGRVPAGESFIWSVGPSAYWPLLDFGTLDALITIQDFRTRQAAVRYKQTIQTAVEEVDDAITNYAAQQNRLNNLGAALVQSRRAVSLASQRYDRGLTDFLNVLDAQRQVYDLEDQFAAGQEAVVLQFIALCKGLGGGWEGFAQPGPPPSPRPAVIAALAKTLNPANDNIPITAPELPEPPQPSAAPVTPAAPASSAPTVETQAATGATIQALPKTQPR